MDATSHSLGILVMDSNYQERFLEMIAPNTAIPVEAKGRFAYAYDGMTSVQVSVIERSDGNSRPDGDVVGTLHLTDLPSRPRGTPIDVVYRYGSDRILQVDIIDVETGTCNMATLKLTGTLGDDIESKRADIAMTVIV
jgi:molecular chaperone DnaK